MFCFCFSVSATQELLLSGEIVPTGPDAARPQQRFSKARDN